MPNYKLAFQWTQPNKGWTEVFYRTATDLPGAATIPQSLLVAMLSFRPGISVLQKVRVSDVINNRTSVIVPMLLSGTSPTGQLPEPTGVAAVVNVSSTAIGSTRKWWARGLSDNDVSRGQISGVDTPGAQLISGINSTLAQLNAGNFTIRSLTKLGAPPNVYTNILSVVTVGGSGQAGLTFTAGPVFAIGSQIVVNQINQKLFPGLRGIFTVLAATPTMVTVGWNPPTTATSLVQKGRFRPAVYQYGLIDNTRSFFGLFSTRSTGKNPLGGRGAKRGARGIRLA